MKIVTVCGKNILRAPWVVPSIRSWQTIEGCDDLHVIDDDTEVASADFQAHGIDVGCVYSGRESESAVRDALTRYPTLCTLRAKDLSWRKILDPAVRFPGERLLLLDTDVFVARPVAMPAGERSMCFMMEGIPAYRATPSLPFRHPMVFSLNAGMVWYDTAMIDLDFLEWIAARYFLQVRTLWWTEQAAWALLAARQEQRYYFSGELVRVFSANSKRTPHQVRENKTVYFGDSTPLKSLDAMRAHLSGAAVIHFSGNGKECFTTYHQGIYPFELGARGDMTPIRLPVIPARTTSGMEKLVISIRLLRQELPPFVLASK